MPFGSEPVSFDYRGAGLGQLVVDRSNEAGDDGDLNQFVTGILADAAGGYGYLQVDYGADNTGGAIHFQHLANGVDSSDPLTFGFGLAIQLPRSAGVSTLVKNLPAARVNLLGGADGETLAGPDGENAWQVTAADKGTLDDSLSFSGIANLQGGAWADTFSFLPGGSVSGNLDGGPGWDTLDYTTARLTGSEPLNLQSGVAPKIAGLASNIERVLLAASDLAAQDDIYWASNVAATDVGAATGVLVNDSDVTGAALTAVLDRATSHGTLAFNADGSFSYVPAAGFVGDDSFGYHVSDGSRTSGEAVVTIHVYTPAEVSQVAVNSDATQIQRSQILSLQVTFSESVNLGSNPAAAFRLTGPDGQLVNLSAEVTTNSDGATVATLTFLAGPDTYQLGNGQYALLNGRFQLTILKNAVRDGDGNPMAADSVDSFFRLFGDARGTGLVDNGDVAAFKYAYGTSSTSAKYLWYLDEDMDGQIGGVDLAAFKADYYKHV